MGSELTDDPYGTGKPEIAPPSIGLHLYGYRYGISSSRLKLPTLHARSLSEPGGGYGAPLATAECFSFYASFPRPDSGASRFQNLNDAHVGSVGKAGMEAKRRRESGEMDGIHVWYFENQVRRACPSIRVREIQGEIHLHKAVALPFG
jgi:hypothetical protein